MKHATESLSAGFIGLDFLAEVGDLMNTDPNSLPATQRDYRLFANERWAMSS